MATDAETQNLRIPVRVVLSAVALILAVFTYFDATFRPDTITWILLGVAALPWLGLIFTSIELPGFVKLGSKALDGITSRADHSGLLASSAEKALPAYAQVATVDPNLALAGLRIEIERRL